MKNSFKYYNYIFPGFLLILCICIYGMNIGNYHFLDTEETKFVSMAKEMLNYNDWINIRLNGEKVLNYNPLFFWITNLCCIIFGKITALSVRLPITIISIIGVLSLFFTVRYILQRIYGLIISLIFALSFGIIIYTHLATNDILSSFMLMLTILSSYFLIFTKNDKFKPLIWSYFFFFCALSVLSTGILGFIIPLVSVTTILLFSGKFKTLIKIKYMYTGIIIFLITILPWQIIMLHKYGITFLKEVINTYSLSGYNFNYPIRVIIMFLLAFCPWVFSFIWILGRKFKDITNSFVSYFKDNSEDKLKEKWNKLKQADKFISINTILFFTTLLFAILWGNEHKYLILFLIFPASCISGYYWYEYIVKKKHDKSIFFATLIPDLILIIISLICIFGHNIINTWLYKGLNHLLVPLIIIFFIIPLIGIISVILKGRILVFLSDLILMLSLSFVIAPSIFNFIILNSGENDLITYAQIANKDKVILSAFIEEKKYSLIYYYDNKINFYDIKDINYLEKYLKKNPKDYVVVEIKDLWDIEAKGIKYMLLDAGKKYCMIQHMTYSIQKLEDNEEPDIIVY